MPAKTCPDCASTNLEALHGTHTLLFCPETQDAAGNRHHHDVNVRRQAYRCGACGRGWSEKLPPSRCWCGWPDDARKDARNPITIDALGVKA